MLRRSLAIGILAIGASMALPPAAHAYPAETTGDLNVRTGPGVRFARIGVLPRFAVINIRFCEGNWCQIDFARGVGWASASYLQGAGMAVPAPYYAPPVVMAPFFGFPFYGPRFYGPRYVVRPRFRYRAPRYRYRRARRYRRR
jgi:uncharacterized protein YraI